MIYLNLFIRLAASFVGTNNNEPESKQPPANDTDVAPTEPTENEPPVIANRASLPGARPK
ncbi:hypothetical protein [Aquicella lusitana]|uniref:hypothetical protein n=1 Tax=Aquicella lusitana TaxID=254246 RepID=UPI000E0AB8CE|nr:hypothetical protein [Aquicella lusitana]